MQLDLGGGVCEGSAERGGGCLNLIFCYAPWALAPIPLEAMAIVRHLPLTMPSML